MIPKLWCHSKGTRAKYFLIAPINCDGCKKEIVFGEQVFHLMDWNPRRVGEFVFCKDCIQKGLQPKGPVPNNFFSQERRMSIVIDHEYDLPPGSFPVELSYHDLTDSRGITTFQAASNKYVYSEKIIDKTNFFGKKDYTFIEDSPSDTITFSNEEHERIEFRGDEHEHE